MKKSYQKQEALINQELTDFVYDFGAHPELSLIPQDASLKIYHRVRFRNGKSYIVMDTKYDAKVAEKFIKIAECLQISGLRAPKIKKYDKDLSLVLMEDFGNNSFTKTLLEKPDKELDLYKCTIEVLSHIASTKFTISLPEHDKNYSNLELDNKFFAEYVSRILDKNSFEEAKISFFSLFSKLLDNVGIAKRVLALKDYHADNLMFLDYEKSSKQQVGLLDFQDAMRGSPAYDLVSLLEDARRDVKPETVKKSKELYLKLTPFINEEMLEYEYSVLGMQRNLKILGIFNRLHFMGRKNYIEYMPRVLKYVREGLKNPVMAELSYWFNYYKIELKL